MTEPRNLGDAWDECEAAVIRLGGKITGLKPLAPGWCVTAEISTNTSITTYQQYGDRPAAALDALRALLTE